MVDKVLFSSKTEEWETPQDLFDRLNEKYHFNLDPCATDENAKCKNYYTKKEDGLNNPWSGRVFCNPPYGRGTIEKWVKKARAEIEAGNAEIVVMLLPVRTDTKWFHEYVLPCTNWITFIRGRLKFGGAKNSAPFPSMVVVFTNEKV